MTYVIPSTYTPPLAAQVDAGSPIDEHLMGDTLAADVIAVKAEADALAAAGTNQKGLAPYVLPLRLALGQNQWTGRGREIDLGQTGVFGLSAIVYANGFVYGTRVSGGGFWIYQWNARTFQLVNSVQIYNSGTLNASSDMIFDGTWLWVVNAKTTAAVDQNLYQINPSSLAVNNKFQLAHPLNVATSTLNGICTDGANIWIGSGDGYLEQFNIAALATVNAYLIVAGTTGTTCVAWDGLNIWILTGASSTAQVYQVNTTSGAVLQSFAAHFTNTIVFDGRYIWYQQTTSTSITGINVITGTAEVTVTVTNLQMAMFFDGLFIWCIPQSATANTTIVRIDVRTFAVLTITTGFSYGTWEPFGLFQQMVPGRQMAYDGTLAWIMGDNISNGAAERKIFSLPSF